MPDMVLIGDLAARLQALPPGTVVGLEGFCGSGKTKLADDLGGWVLMSVCHLDSFAKKFDQPPPYTKCLDLGALRRALEQRDQSRPTLVEGICLRDVLALVDISPEIFVYLKRIGQNRLWYDGLHLEDFDAGQPVPGEMQEPHRSDLEYHARVRPHERPDLIYERVEDDW